MSSQLGFYPKFHGTDPSTGMPLVGGLLYTYAAGTSTPLATYADAGLTTPNSNPIVLDSTGEALIYCACSAYKFVLQNSLGVQLWTVDNYSPCASGGGGGGGSGTVTSVGLAATSEFSVSGSPVTTTGTLTLGKANQAANTVWAGPASGAAAQPTFRALVAADIPGGVGGGGTLQSQVFTANGTFAVPSTVTAVWLTMIGGGGAGASSISTLGAGGGGAGELCEMFMVPVAASSNCAVVVGAGGVGSTSNPGANGSASSFNNNTFLFSVLGGIGGGGVGAANAAGVGGGVQGARTGSGVGAAESPAHFGGAAGGAGGNVSSPFSAGGGGGGAPGYVTGAAGGTTNGGTGNGGGGGAATLWGAGGVGGNAGSSGTSAPATSYGSGGGGAGQGTGLSGGSGAGGRVEVYWVG